MSQQVLFLTRYLSEVLNSVIFEDINLKFCTHIHQSLPFNMYFVFFKNFGFRRKFWKRKENVENVFKIFPNIFEISEI